MADVYNYIASTGVITTDAGEILQQVGQEYKDTFGQDLVVPDSLNIQGASTPQGLLIVTEALARIGVADNNAALANQINPNLAGGIFLDAVLALLGIQRDPARPSTVLCTLTGVVGTSIPAGSQASVDVTGDLFELVETTVIPSGGIAENILFQSVSTGAIAAPAGDLTNIVSDVLGWETITNPSDATLGADTQSDVAARAVRLNTLAAQGSSVAQAIISGVTQVPGVTSIAFLENIASTTEVIDGITMVPHSIYACVNGGSIGTKSIVKATLTGTPATLIPAGSQAAYGTFIFETTEDATIGGGGSVDDVEFVALQTGSISVPPGGLATIITPVVGWSTVSNPLAGTAGDESTVAQALVSKKSAGASYNNGLGVNISTVVTVPYSNQQMTILFDQPNEIAINVIVNARVATPVQDPYSAIKDSIAAYAAGEINGLTGLVVGQDVSSFELAGAITTQYPGIFVESILIAISPATPTTSTTIPIGVYEIATIDDAAITVNLI